MNNHNRGVFASLEHYLDMLLNMLTGYIAWFLTCLILGSSDVNPASPEVVIWLLIFVILSGFTYQAFNIYSRPVFFKISSSIIRIIEANLTFFGILAVYFALFGDPEKKTFILVWVLVALLVSTAILTFKRRIMRSVFRVLHAKQFILRKVIIVGDNTASANEYINQIEKNPQYGMMILGYVGNKKEDEVGCDKLGAFTDLEKILDEHMPTDVVFAIDAYDKRHLIRLVNICDDRCIRVFFLPVIYGFFKTHKQLEQVGSLPVINIHTTPLDNRANAFLKRLIDVVGSLALIIITSPLMLFAAIGTRLSSKGPILFKQERVGKMGKPFVMLKFRSMVVNEESDTKWTEGKDERKTRFGTFLRRTAIDELPQLFNVLMGSMSLVGPRPELPKFVEAFRKDIPLYMVKHYVKPGLTGLAQIKGLRGDTSVEDRIHEDIDYIENWTLWLDIYILLCTPFKAFNKNEQYVEQEGADSEDKPEKKLIDKIFDLFRIKKKSAEENTSDAEAREKSFSDAEEKAEAPSAEAEAKPTEAEAKLSADVAEEAEPVANEAVAEAKPAEAPSSEAEAKPAEAEEKLSAEVAEEAELVANGADSEEQPEETKEKPEETKAKPADAADGENSGEGNE